MHLNLAPELQGNTAAEEAARIVGKCVHCGFCNASCPTYRLLGDELDGPRGRIYLMKGLLEGAPATAKTQLHLDRCLTCRACETACPSGVDYGRLLDTGRALSTTRVRRSLGSRFVRTVLRETLTRPRLFGTLLRVGQALRPVLPLRLREKVPVGLTGSAGSASSASSAGSSGAQAVSPAPPVSAHRRVLLLSGCVQPALSPGIHRATVRVLGALGIEAIIAPAAGCCGAIRQHLDDSAGALDEARRNIDAWWPWIEPRAVAADVPKSVGLRGGIVSAAPVEAIISNASGCGVQLRDYGHLLRQDPLYAARAARVAALARDVAQVVAPEAEALAKRVRPADARLVFQSPCTLQHGQGVRGQVEGLLTRLGAELLPCADSHLCCGSAGTYSLLQPELSQELRSRKLAALQRGGPQAIVSANIGCITHLGYATEVPVQHWIEWIDAQLMP
jgi:glycolate oxidase iron-sulfur subunit